MLSISSSKSGHIVRVVQGATVTIFGLTFKDSKTSNGFIDNEGTLTLSNSIVSGNTASTNITGSGGGGIDNEGTLTLSNTTISDNTSTIPNNLGGSGGGIFNDGTLTLSNSTVSGNTATGLGSGGGIYSNIFSTLMLKNSTISGNTSAGAGGILSGSTATITNSTVSDNTATGQFGNGGGIWSEGRLRVSNSTISGNTASHDGGGISNDIGGTLTLSNSTVSDNTATGGGGIAISDHENGITGVFRVQVMLLYSTVYGNTAAVGGGIWIDNFDKKSQVTMGASIVAGNNAHTAPDIAGPLTTLGYNLVGDRSGATFLGPSKVQSTDKVGVSSTDLKIDPLLRDNGGSTNPHTLTHALLPDSPAIDAIPLQDCQVKDIFNSRSRMYTDQCGMKRPDGNEQFCDIGAYESVDLG